MGVLAMKTLADRGFFGQNRCDVRPTGVSHEERQRIIEKVTDLAGNAVEYYKA